MTPHTEALLAVDPRDLTEAERAALDAALAADEDAAHVALTVAFDAELDDDIADPLTAPAPVAERVASRRTLVPAVAAALLLAAVVALVVLLRSSSDESEQRAHDVAPAPREPLPERRDVAPAPEIARDGLRALPTGGARPKPRRAAAPNAKTARAHAKRGLAHKKAGEHGPAAFAYVDAFRALPSEPALAYTAAAELERAGRCADAVAWFRLAVSLAPGADWSDEATRRADTLSGDCDERDAVISTTGPNAVEARARYRLAGERYDAGDFRGAARLFAGAYDGMPVPELAYNVAAAYHRSDDCANTVAWFRHYLAISDAAADRDEVEGIIAAYERVGCDDPVTHAPPREADVVDPKRTFQPPKNVSFPDDDESDAAAELADRASEAAKRGNYGRAYKACDDALDLDPTNRKAQMVCTIAACKLKNHKRARRHYARLSASAQRMVVALCEQAGIELPAPGEGDDGNAGALPERLSRREISAPINRVRDLIAECGSSSDFTGTMTVRMRIEPDGRVASAVADEAGDAGTCVEQVILNLQFPRSREAISVSYPLVFR